MAKQEEPIEKQLWKTADKLRKNIDAAEYKHIVLGLVFLKYISDAFDELYDKLKAEGERRCRPRGQGRVQGRERLLRAARRAVELSCKARPSSPPSARRWMRPWTPSSGRTTR
jgi:type I restriction-modification system DNA methylase subunit